MTLKLIMAVTHETVITAVQTCPEKNVREIRREYCFWVGNGHPLNTNPVDLPYENGQQAGFVGAAAYALSNPQLRALWCSEFLKCCPSLQQLDPNSCPQFYNWLQSGHFIFDNPWGIEWSSGCTMDFPSAFIHMKELAITELLANWSM